MVRCLWSVKRGFQCNQGEGLIGAAHKGFSALDPTLDDVALRPSPAASSKERLKCAAEK